MKLPKTRKKYCPKCKKHHEHKVLESKNKGRGKTHPLSQGSKKRIKQRGSLGTGNDGKYSKPPINKWKMAGKKTSKKVDLRFECQSCKKRHGMSSGGFRLKKVEFK